MIGGQSGISGHFVGDNVQIGGGSGVVKIFLQLQR